MNTPKIIRNISGTIAALMCAVLIFIFGLMPLFNYEVCPIKTDDDRSIYSGGSVAFVREIDPEKLEKGDIAVYYSGQTAIGVEVVTSDKNAQKIYAKAENGTTVELSYRKISGKGTSFSVPLFGGYADWLVNGSGLLVSVIILGTVFVIFAVSAIATREEE